eukprot:CAMPEP_0201493088 /NCGR_PEP_ID=MMETSP0151_2-20130828/36095_1 /ASSEMBLY_ACC=CAM_ASM_000257 /TAXON_ID=200890 /ORGANISM="Paramoeba atlantica, Strain 621/1 / CCAP 1560/9" /LENGTH=181 /DNA_ID=CAMNT_0047880249 /DNA_START=37 /DNA_END=582 /DNA_ORIENTATION=-
MDWIWADGEHLKVSEDRRSIEFFESGTTVAIGQTPLNFEENFFFEVKIKSRAVFEEACLIGISDKWMYQPGYSSVLGSTPTSWGWRRDGSKNHGGVISSYSPPHTRTKVEDDAIEFKLGVEYDSNTKALSFFDNGENRGVAFTLDSKNISCPLYPAVTFASSDHFVTFDTENYTNVKPAKR